MKIVLSGVETNNKGAELMFYAILQEIERRFPDAIVYVAPYSVSQGLDYLQTPLQLKDKPISVLQKWLKCFHVYGIIRRLHISLLYLNDIYAISDTDYFIDGGGYHFSDQWNWPELLVEQRRRMWKAFAKIGTRIVFLPQAFGPFTQNYSKQHLGNMARYAHLIMPREQVSYNYLKGTGLVDMNKVKLFPDFTSLVNGTFPEEFSRLKNGVCIIPNMKMIDKGSISFEKYINLLKEIVEHVRKKGKLVYLLNHEGKGDEELAYQCKKVLNDEIEVVTGLNALDVKGVISSAYLVISSRFHGVVSALNTCVPCLATSWSHKYNELYKDYDLQGCILPVENTKECIQIVDQYIDVQRNTNIRKHLHNQLFKNQQKTKEMWKEVWSLI